MSRNRTVRRFALAFGVTLTIVGAAALLRDGGGQLTDTPEATARRTSLTTVAVPPPTEAVTTEVGPAPPVGTLPRLEFIQLCVQVEGDGSTFVEGDRFGLRCRTSAGTERVIDLQSGCERFYGEGTRAVLVEENSGSDAWRCTTRDRIELEQPDWRLECHRRFGATADAFLIADDSLGWRCASVIDGVFAVDEVAVDAACQATYGPETFGEIVGSAPEDNRCYGAAV